MKDIFTDLANAIENKKYSFRDIHQALLKGEEYRKGLLARAPAKVGDTVFLTKTPDINEKDSWGWMGSKHFLIEGAKAEVRDVDFYEGKFRFGLAFENQSYICDFGENKGKIIPRAEKERSIFYFGESYISKTNPIEDSTLEIIKKQIEEERNERLRFITEYEKFKRKLKF